MKLAGGIRAGTSFWGGTKLKKKTFFIPLLRSIVEGVLRDKNKFCPQNSKQIFRASPPALASPLLCYATA